MPSTIVEVVDAPPPRSAPTSTDALFVAVEAEKGPVNVATEINSKDALERVFGGRTLAGQLLFDTADAFFAEGGSRLVVSRYVGPAAVEATANAFDAAGSTIPGDVSLVVTAKDPGEWANALNFEVTVNGTDFTIIVSHDVDGVLETSGLLADRAAAVAWSQDTSEYIDLTLGASAEDPRAQGPTGLTTGADDRASITLTQVETALEAFSHQLGPGQVTLPGRTAQTSHEALLEHAAANNRVALLDGADTAVVATLTAASAALGARTDARYGHLLAPWAVIPGVVQGTTRQVPYSAIQAGILARNDSADQSPNQASAGENGRSRYAIDLTQTFTDAQYDTLDAAGVTLARETYGQIATEGIATVADPDSDPLWDQFQSTRLLMKLTSLAQAVAWRNRFNQIDGKGLVFSRLKSDLEGEVCLPYYRAGSLYGDSPEEAFRVDTGPQVNTPETIAAKQIRAAIGVRPSPGAELVYIQIARTAITQPV